MPAAGSVGVLVVDTHTSITLNAPHFLILSCPQRIQPADPSARQRLALWAVMERLWGQRLPFSLPPRRNPRGRASPCAEQGQQVGGPIRVKGSCSSHPCQGDISWVFCSTGCWNLKPSPRSVNVVLLFDGG